MYSETKSNETLKTVKVIKPKSFKNKKNTKVTSKADEELVLMDKFSIPDKIFGWSNRTLIFPKKILRNVDIRSSFMKYNLDNKMTHQFL